MTAIVACVYVHAVYIIVTIFLCFPLRQVSLKKRGEFNLNETRLNKRKRRVKQSNGWAIQLKSLSQYSSFSLEIYISVYHNMANVCNNNYLFIFIIDSFTNYFYAKEKSSKSLN